MILGIQILAILFALIMMYFTFLYYKRANYDKKGLIFWFVVWGGFMILAIFPSTIYGVMGFLEIERTADFFYIAGFLFLSAVMFYVYNTTKKNQKQLETLVRKMAHKQAEKKK